MKKRLSLILITIIIFTNIGVHSEMCIEENLRSYLLADVETGQILESYNIDEVVEIASISKLMTYLIVMDNISGGNISSSDLIRIDKDTAKIGGSSLKLKEGEVFTVGDLLKGAIVVSGNDAAYALSKHVAGTEKEFTKLMNEKAKEIGLTSGVFYNSTGLPVYGISEQNKMTVRDIFKLSQYIIKKYPEILDISRLRAIKMIDRDFYGRNTNPLLMRIDEVDGLKTGFTNAAGWSYVSTFKIKEIENETKDLRLISVVMGCEDMETRNQIARELIEKAIDNYSNRIFLDKNIPVGSLELPKSDLGRINVFAKTGYSKIVKKDEDIGLSLDIYEDIQLPLRKNQKIGTGNIIENGRVIFKTDIIVKIQVNKADWYTIFTRNIKGFFQQMP